MSLLITMVGVTKGQPAAESVSRQQYFPGEVLEGAQRPRRQEPRARVRGTIVAGLLVDEVAEKC